MMRGVPSAAGRSALGFTLLTEGSPKPWIEIVPTRGWRGIDFRELWAYRELLYILAWRDVKVRYRQTLLGVGWVLAQPLITVAIFTVLFHRVANIQPDVDAPYVVFVMAAMVPWTFFATGIAASSNSLIGSSHLISKVYFPRMLVPGASVMAGLVDTAVTIAAVLVLMLLTGTPVGWTVILIPLALVVGIVLTLGVGLWLSALNVEYRDIRVLIPVVIQLWLYATPVVYPLAVLPEAARLVVRLNPMTGVVGFFRNALIGAPLDWTAFGYSALMAVIVLVTGSYYFRRMERLFADVL